MKELIEILETMKHSTLNNYIVPGLESSLVGGEELGKVRIFSSTRTQQHYITPHSHRFDFTCLVLRGSVTSTIWESSKDGDLYHLTGIKYNGKPGEYDLSEQDHAEDNFSAEDSIYAAGDSYSMIYSQIHSVKFSKGAVVLFFEGPQVTDKTVMLEPIVNGEVVPTGMVKSWMFRK